MPVRIFQWQGYKEYFLYFSSVLKNLYDILKWIISKIDYIKVIHVVKNLKALKKALKNLVIL